MRWAAYPCAGFLERHRLSAPSRLLPSPSQTPLRPPTRNTRFGFSCCFLLSTGPRVRGPERQSPSLLDPSPKPHELTPHAVLLNPTAFLPPSPPPTRTLPPP